MKIKKITKIDPEELNSILEKLEQREFIEVVEKKGLFGKKVEIKKCVGEIIDSLCNRKGFDDWWYNLDDDVETEIILEIESIIKKRLAKNNG